MEVLSELNCRGKNTLPNIAPWRSFQIGRMVHPEWPSWGLSAVDPRDPFWHCESVLYFLSTMLRKEMLLLPAWAMVWDLWIIWVSLCVLKSISNKEWTCKCLVTGSYRLWLQCIKTKTFLKNPLIIFLYTSYSIYLFFPLYLLCLLHSYCMMEKY